MAPESSHPSNPTTRNWLIALVAFIALLCVCGVCATGGGAVAYPIVAGTLQARSTETAVAYAHATATAETEAFHATATAQAASLAESSWTLGILDPFDSNANRWVQGNYDDAFAKTTYSFLNGKYRFDINAHQGVVLRSTPTAKRSTIDFYAAVEAQRLSGNTDEPYGLAFRDDGVNYYLFNVSDTQNFAVFMWRNEGWTTLVDWTPSTAIIPDKVNRLAVIGKGSHFDFFINGRHVAEAEDDHLAEGLIGVAINLNSQGDAIFEFDNFEVRVP